jgi:protein-tyrosine phosphatase
MGASIAIACRGGIDRSGMTASCVLVEAGLDPQAAMARVQAARRGSITLDEQRDYVGGWPHAD